jgi:SPOR domain
MMQRSILYVAFCCLPCTSLWGQEVQINAEPAVSQLFQTWVRANRASGRIAGWRVQIMSGTERSAVEQGKVRFLGQFPEVPADWIHEKPYYKLRVGAFRSRLAAQAFIAQLRDTYPGAYPAMDANILPREFLF